MKKIKEIRWGIIGDLGLYIGQCLTRKEMIKEHIEDIGITWKEAKKKGDKAVKLKIEVLEK